MIRLPLVAVALLAVGCDTVGVDARTPDIIPLASLSQDAEALVGTWDWVASVGAFRQPGVRTPESTGDTETWTFRPDGTATWTFNREVVLETTYRVERRAYDNGTRDERPSLQFEGGGYGQGFGTVGDLLVLDSRPVDGPQARYVHRR